MSIEIKIISPSDTSAWDTYVNAHPRSTLYHVSGWKNIIEKTYGHKTYYLMAIKNVHDPVSSIQHPVSSIQKIVGILPLVHLKHFLFGNSLISIPFFDIGGILADDVEIEKALLSEAIKLGHEIKASTIELRHIEPLACADSFRPCQLTRNPQPATEPFRPDHIKFACSSNCPNHLKY